MKFDFFTTQIQNQGAKPKPMCTPRVSHEEIRATVREVVDAMLSGRKIELQSTQSTELQTMVLQAAAEALMPLYSYLQTQYGRAWPHVVEGNRAPAVIGSFGRQQPVDNRELCDNSPPPCIGAIPRGGTEPVEQHLPRIDKVELDNSPPPCIRGISRKGPRNDI